MVTRLFNLLTQKTSILLSVFTFIFINTISGQTIEGIVLDSVTQKPIENAVILIESTNELVTTGIDGAYRLSVDKSGNYTIICKHIGFETQQKIIQILKETNLRVNFFLNSKTEELKEVEIFGFITKPIQRKGDVVFSGTEVTQKGINLLGATVSNSILGTLQTIPSVLVNSSDAYGLSETMTRIRGMRNLFSGVTMEGIPNYGIMPIGARNDIYDRENIKQITLYKGAVPVDVLAATGNRGGTVDVSYRRPEELFGVDVSQMVGDDNYLRTFLRFDTGKITKSTTLFGSYSFTSADKWKGKGILGKRNHYNIGLSQKLGKHVEFEFFGNYNEISKHHFKHLNYNEISSLDGNYGLDYNETLTGIPSADINYFDYNQGNYENYQNIASVQFSREKFSSTVKGYLNRENTQYGYTTQIGSQYLKQDRTRNLQQWGIIAEGVGSFEKIKYMIGYWFESFDNLVYVYNNSITSTGLTPKGYAFYTVPYGNGMIHNPYIKWAYENHKFKIQAGIKYIYFKEPESERFMALNATELKPVPEVDLHTGAILQQALLPSVGIGYQIQNQWEIYANYGKNYMRPYMYIPTITVYLQNRNAFLSQNWNLQKIYDLWRMETSHHFEVGTVWSKKSFHINGNIFFSRQNNILATVYNPEVGVNFGQNVGKINAYGVEVETFFQMFKSASVFFNPSWTKVSYNDNVVFKTTSGVNTLSIKGNQSPATPEFMLKSGVLYDYKNLNINILCNYTGKRFGDATNLEEVPAYTVFDSSLQYKKNFDGIFKSFTIGAELKNLTNKKYVGIIDTSDESMNGNAAYFTGFPRTFISSLKLEF